MMFVDSPCPVTVSARALGIDRAARPDQHLALGVLAAGDRADLVVGQSSGASR